MSLIDCDDSVHSLHAVEIPTIYEVVLPPNSEDSKGGFQYNEKLARKGLLNMDHKLKNNPLFEKKIMMC